MIRNTAKFLEVEISEKDVEKLQEHLSFKNMKDNNSVNYLDLVIEAKKESGTDDDELVFMRRGECGDWMDLYPEELIGN